MTICNTCGHAKETHEGLAPHRCVVEKCTCRRFTDIKFADKPKPKLGWRVEGDGERWACVFHSDGNDVASISGLSRLECVQFLALYMSFLVTGRKNDAETLFQGLMTKGTH